MTTLFAGGADATDPGIIGGKYHAGLPSSTRPARAFEPLPRRTSPKPWDSENLRRHFETMPKEGEADRAARRRKWDWMHAMAVGASADWEGRFTELSSALGNFKAYHGMRFNRVELRRMGNWGKWQLTRVE